MNEEDHFLDTVITYKNINLNLELPVKRRQGVLLPDRTLKGSWESEVAAPGV